jgi:hypothetical protein
MDTNGSIKKTDITNQGKVEAPKVVDIKINLIPYKARELRNIKTRLARFNKTIEILVKMNRDMAIIGESYPTLSIGDYEVTEMNLVDNHTLRFLAFNTGVLKDGEPILFGWYGTPKEFRIDTVFKYKLPGRTTS